MVLTASAPQVQADITIHFTFALPLLFLVALIDLMYISQPYNFLECNVYQCHINVIPCSCRDLHGFSATLKSPAASIPKMFLAKTQPARS